MQWVLLSTSRKMQKKLLLFTSARCKQTLNDLDAKIFARYSQHFAATELVISGTQCIIEILQPLSSFVKRKQSHLIVHFRNVAWLENRTGQQ